MKGSAFVPFAAASLFTEDEHTCTSYAALRDDKLRDDICNSLDRDHEGIFRARDTVVQGVALDRLSACFADEAF